MAIAPTQTSGYADLLVRERKSEADDGKLVKDECVQHEKKTQRQLLLRYDGQAYRVPDDLKSVDMPTNRLEAFSDGVIAIIITIMVLELQGAARRRLPALAAAAAGVPQLRAELRLRRHLLEQPPPPVARRRRASTGAVLWANLHLLFWLSLFPFATAWMGENHFARAARRRSTASCC